MRWSDVRTAFPDRWLVVEALEARSERGHRILARLAVVAMCEDGGAAFARYRELHRQQPQRELYFVHTSNLDLDIEERTWIGIRTSHAPDAA